MKRERIEMDNPAIPNMNSTLPDGWRWARLGDVCQVFGGSPAPQDKRCFENGEYPFVRVQDLGRHGRTINLVETKDYINDLAIRELNMRKAEKGTILFPKSGAAITTNSRAILGIDAFIVSHLAAVKAREGIADAHFVYYWLCLTDMVQHMENPGYPSLKLSTISKIFIPLPSLEIQQRIGARVQELMQEVERTRTACEKQLEAAKTLPATYLRQVFTSDEAKEWERKRLREVYERIIGGGTPRRGHPEYWRGSIYWLSPSELDADRLNYVNQTKEKITEEGSKNSNAKIIPPKSVLLTCTASVGKVAINEVPLSTNQQFNSFVLKDKVAIPEFVAYYLIYRKEDIKQLGGKTTFTFISKDEIANFPIPVPSLSIQQHVASELKEKMAYIEKLRTSIKKQLKAINALPQTISKKAFRGAL